MIVSELCGFGFVHLQSTKLAGRYTDTAEI